MIVGGTMCRPLRKTPYYSMRLCVTPRVEDIDAVLLRPCSDTG